MKCVKCGYEQVDSNTECPYCGIIFKKINIKKNEQVTKPVKKEMEYEPQGSWIKSILFSVSPNASSTTFIFRSIVFLFLLVLGIKILFLPLNSDYSLNSFWHLINLPFHEAGHIIFRPFGRFITSLGGTLGQLLVPLICMFTFLIQTKDPFAASFTLWWFGENFIDIAPYIDDSQRLTMPLLGGNTGQTSPYGFHDWQFILTESGVVDHCHEIALFSLFMGKFIIIIAVLWGAYLIYEEYKEVF